MIVTLMYTEIPPNFKHNKIYNSQILSESFQPIPVGSESTSTKNLKMIQM